MQKLIRGIVEFQKNVLPSQRDMFARLALGQKPDSLFIACSDSRVVPNLFASTDPGDLFVIRNVGNLIPKANSEGSMAEGAAIEFAVQSLNIKNIIVCGHSECGAAQALLKPNEFQAPHFQNWLSNGREAVTRYMQGLAPDKSLSPANQVSQLNTVLQLEHLKTYPCIWERYKNNELGLHAWWFDIRTACVYSYEDADRRFVAIDENEAEVLMERMNLKSLHDTAACQHDHAPHAGN